MPKSGVETLVGTVYSPTKVLPALAASSTKVSLEPVVNVTVNLLPAITLSDIVAVTFTFLPTPYEPSVFVEVNFVTVGRVVSLYVSVAPVLLFCVNVPSLAAAFKAWSLTNPAVTSIVSAPPAAAKPEVASRAAFFTPVRVAVMDVALT